MEQRDRAARADGTALLDEWEYEYSEDRMEDYYFVLELPIPTPEDAAYTKKRRYESPQSSHTPSDGRQDRSHSASWSPDPTTVEQAPAKESIQMIDTHTLKPLVAYRGKIYSCKWASTIGTDMLFRRPSVEEEYLAGPPSRLVATTSAKLVGRPAVVRPKTRTDPPPPAHSVTKDLARGRARSPQKTIDPADRKRKQAEFLQRLQEAKRQRGETDIVPTEPVLTFTKPPSYVDPEQYRQAREAHEARKNSRKNKKRLDEQNAQENDSNQQTPPSTEQITSATHEAPLIDRGTGLPPKRRRRKPRGGRKQGRYTTGRLRTILGFRDEEELNGGFPAATPPMDEDSGSQSISTPTPSHFDFNSEGRIASVPME
ncbi:MAG: hypothetical protein M1820_008231 [Bogoriella megaspora]|nr:MAG: hypothetical protein M1820_008231 [Bogoriella megaspora]